LGKAAKGLDDQVLAKINISIANKKPAYLAVLIVDTLKERAGPRMISIS
jgi:hypothetical protein